MSSTITATVSTVTYQQVMEPSSQTATTYANVSVTPSAVTGDLASYPISPFTISIQNVNGSVNYFPNQTVTITLS
jgi:hypothetical protein